MVAKISCARHYDLNVISPSVAFTIFMVYNNGFLLWMILSEKEIT